METHLVINPTEADQELKTLRQEAGGLVEFANRLQIKSAADNQLVADFNKSVREKRGKLWDGVSRYVNIAFKAHKDLTSLRAQDVAPFDEAARISGEKLLVWDREQKLIIQQREQKAREEETKRQKAEAEKTAKHYEKVGQPQVAQTIRESAVQAAPVAAAPPPAPARAAVKVLENWDFRILNADLIPRQYLIPDESAIRKVVKALKTKTAIPGIEVFDRGSIR